MILMRITKTFLLCCMIILLFFMLGCDRKGGELKKAPDFDLVDLSGNRVTLSEHKGKTVLLDFWATWCPPCRKSIPELVDLQERYREQGVVVLGISMDDPRQINNRHLTAFKERFRINYRILRADLKTVQDYFGDSNISIPTMFVIDKKGRIADSHVGFMPGLVESSIKGLL